MSALQPDITPGGIPGGNGLDRNEGGYEECVTRSSISSLRSRSRTPSKGKPLSGGGLYYRGGRWFFRYTSQIDGKESDITIGPVHSVSLKAARERAADVMA